MKNTLRFLLLIFVSNLFGQGSRPPVTTLSGMSDVSITSPANGDLLKYNTSTSKWINGALVAPALSTLPDVSIVSTASNQVLKWDSVSSKWVNYGPLAFTDIGGSITPGQLQNTLGTAGSSTYYRGDGAWTAIAVSVTVATLPASPFTAQLATVSDGTASLAWGATVTGGGSTKYLVWWNGTNWTVIGK